MMAGQRGRDVLLKIQNETGQFITVAGIRTKRLQLASGLVDGTNADSPEAWRALITGAGVKSARLTGAGIFKDKASDGQMQMAFFAGSIEIWKLILPDFGEMTGPFQITELTYSGDHNGEAGFSITLESAGQLIFEVLT